MKKLIILTTILIGGFNCLKAQTINNAITEHDAIVKAKDAAIKTEIIDPEVQASSGEAPDWTALTQTINQKYDAITADRTITKAKIYFYYSHDKAVFCTSVVHYTNNFELANDYKMLNLNAIMILQSDNSPAELKEALHWAKTAADSDTGNEEYKETYRALLGKLDSKN